MGSLVAQASFQDFVLLAFLADVWFAFLGKIKGERRAAYAFIPYLISGKITCPMGGRVLWKSMSGQPLSQQTDDIL